MVVKGTETREAGDGKGDAVEINDKQGRFEMSAPVVHSPMAVTYVAGSHGSIGPCTNGICRKEPFG